MNAAENVFIRLLQGTLSLDAVPVSQLEEVADRYPYFSHAQLLLTHKYLATGHPQAEARLQYTAQWWANNLPWLHAQLPCTGTPPAGTQAPATQVAAEPAADAGTNPAATDDAHLITLPAAGVLNHMDWQESEIHDEPELPPLDEESTGELPDAALASLKIADILQHQAQDFQAPVSPASTLPIEAEPAHVKDYFASQGIHIDNETEDAFSKKVHRFTDWLKQMKRINHVPADLGSDPEMENYVQTIADTSNQLRDIYTETLAEVLLKQGKKDKALEVYEKLCLLNPAKTAYFAAKIQQLKDI